MSTKWRRPTVAELRDTCMAFLLGVLISAFVAVMVVQAAERDEAEALEVALTTSAAIAETTDLDELAAKFGVTIVWTDDDRNCGLGCYRRGTPDVIYVEPGHDAVKTRHIVLHEVGHALHHRLGLPSSEADADRFAESMECFAQSMDSTMGNYCPVIPEL